MTDTPPPTLADVAVVPPANSIMLPPAPLLVPPTNTETAPAEPLLATPVARTTLPAAPLAVVPDDSTAKPEPPDVSAPPVIRDTVPLDCTVEPLDRTTTPEPALEEPLAMMTAPLAAATVVPELNTIEPLTDDDSAPGFAVRMTTAPELDDTLAPDAMNTKPPVVDVALEGPEKNDMGLPTMLLFTLGPACHDGKKRRQQPAALSMSGRDDTNSASMQGQKQRRRMKSKEKWATPARAATSEPVVTNTQTAKQLATSRTPQATHTQHAACTSGPDSFPVMMVAMGLVM